MGLAQPWLRKSTQTWFVQFGKKQHSLGKDKYKAFQKYAQLLRERGVATDDESISLHSLVDAYCDWIQPNRAATTCKILRPRLASFKQHVPDMPAKNLKPHHVEKWARKSSSVSPTTVHNYISGIVALFNWAVRYGYLSRNPIAKMPNSVRRANRMFKPSSTGMEAVSERWKREQRSAWTSYHHANKRCRSSVTVDGLLPVRNTIDEICTNTNTSRRP